MTIPVTNSKLECMDYPVGKNMDKNKNLILLMIKELNSIVEFTDKEVNLICMGSSGTIVATIFSMGIPNKNKIVHIKKDGEKAHNSYIDNLDSANLINVIVDDFVASGATMNTIYKKLKERTPSVKIDCLAVSSDIKLNKLEFVPKYTIAQEVD